MSIKAQLMTDLKSAMRAKDSETRNTIRLLQAAIKQAEIDSQTELDDKAITAILAKQAKQRREAIDQYEQSGRSELAATEKSELVIIERYLPQMMSRAEIETLVAAAIADVGATSARDMGKVMGRLMPHVKGKADGRVVNEVVRSQLAT